MGDQGDSDILPQKFTPKTQGVKAEQLKKQSLTGRVSQTMGRQRNKPQMKGKEEVSKTMLNEKEASQLSDNEFKELVIRKLNELTENYEKLEGNYNELTANYINMKKEIETIKKGQQSMKNTISELKNTVEGSKNRSDEAEDQNKKLEDKVKKTPRMSKKKKRGSERMKRG